MTADTTTNHRSELLARALDHLDRGELDEVWATGRIPGRDATVDWDATGALRRHLGVTDPAAVVVTTDGAAARWQSGLGRWDPVPGDTRPQPRPVEVWDIYDYVTSDLVDTGVTDVHGYQWLVADEHGEPARVPVAEVCVVLPELGRRADGVWRHPDDDRPWPWAGPGRPGAPPVLRPADRPRRRRRADLGVRHRPPARALRPEGAGGRDLTAAVTRRNRPGLTLGAVPRPPPLSG
jgi:hypothetical protein